MKSQHFSKIYRLGKGSLELKKQRLFFAHSWVYFVKKFLYLYKYILFAFPYLLMVGICTIFSIYISLFSHFFAIMIRKQEKKSSSCLLVGFCLRRNMCICTRIDRQFSKAHAKCAISGRKNIWNCMERSSQRARRKKKLSSNDFWTKKIVINICNDKKITARFLPNSDRFRADSCAVERLKVNWNLCSSNSTSVSQSTLLDCK